MNAEQITELARKQILADADRLIAAFYDSADRKGWPAWATEAVLNMEELLVVATQPQAPQGAVTGWQPIETAPEGTMILCANMTAREARHWAFVAWLVDGKVCGHRMDMPTHWMPLPAAPETPEGKK